MDYITAYKLLGAILRIILLALRAYSFVWFIWIILSWLRAFGAVQLDPYNPVVRTLARITDGVVDKVFGRFRYKLIIGMFDLSPLVFLVVLNYILPSVLVWLFNMLLGFLRTAFYG